MTLVKRYHRDAPSLFDVNWMDDFFGNHLKTFQSTDVKVNVKEDEESYTLDVLVPGYKDNELNVEIEDGVLFISGQHEKTDEKEDDGYHLREFSKGSFKRSFKLTSNVEAENLAANLKDGVLTIRLPKAAEVKPKRIPITV